MKNGPVQELTTPLLKLAYENGFFPMPDPESGQILWFHPDPRAIIPLENFHSSRSLMRSIRKRNFEFAIDQDFVAVINACADRSQFKSARVSLENDVVSTGPQTVDPSDETWIDEQMIAAYHQLFLEGHAHSIETYVSGKLVGGVYGVAFKGVFCAESKFHRVTDASKAALWHLVEHMKSRKMLCLEVQFLTPHLKSLGAIEVTRDEYLRMLAAALKSGATFCD
jgi:leucyl/phenylalanyl-tRNA---protein transferase